METSRSGLLGLRLGATGVLTGLALAWLLGSTRVTPLQAQPNQPAEAAGVIAFTSGGSGSPQLLYLIDTRSQALAIYRVDPDDHKGTLKLEAARQYRWDLKLGEFNNQPPEVTAVESMVGAVRP